MWMWMCLCACLPLPKSIFTREEIIAFLKFVFFFFFFAEMFSYGFQPWAAQTGHQILESIDEPNYQVSLYSRLVYRAHLFYSIFN